MIRLTSVLLYLSLLMNGAVAHAQTKPANADAMVKKIASSGPFRKAAAALEAGHDQWVKDLVTLTEIAAPPFKETARARVFAAMLRKRGLVDVEIDEEGNVLGRRPGSVAGKAVMVTAHLDTVFPEATDVQVRREGDKLHAPGIGDDSAGLSTMLALIDAMNAGGVKTRSDIIFVGTVGEEGLGDLRGVRHLFAKGKYKDQVRAFFSIDDTGLEEITTQALGSKRYRVTYKGPGGHSYGAFGIVNPMAALGRMVTDLYAISAPTRPKTTYSASVVGGGTSVNAIPQEVWIEVDMRSESPEELVKLERQFLAIVKRSVEEENAARSTKAGAVSAEPKVIGDRPAGQNAPGADIVQFTKAAYRSQNIEVKDGISSTDANIPMSLGIPSVTLAGNAIGDRAHAPDEWIDPNKAANVKLKRILLTSLLAAAGN
ncbi:MAG: M20/M25/M40 family metallo-hydrolase [Sphingosinicella sp.]|nr:M20/M25/M40 family metallo-hydrolase [Sphingosinicella sp.]